MSKAEDQLDTGGAITDLVFDDNHHERRSWRDIANVRDIGHKVKRTNQVGAK